MEKTKAIIDGKNVTTDWIGEVFDAADYTQDGKCIVGFVGHFPMLVAWDDNYIVWQAVLGGENCFDVLEKRLALFEDEESNIYSECKRVARNLILQSFCFKEEYMMTCECGKRISDVEYIRYGGVCKECWHKYNIKKNNK